MDDKTHELVFIAAAYAGGCEPCLLYHMKAALQMEVEPHDIKHAIEIGMRVKEISATREKELVKRILGDDQEETP